MRVLTSLLGLLLTAVLTKSSLGNKTSDISVRPFERLLSRKRRSFVFFPGTTVSIAVVMNKALMLASPRGFVQTNEMTLVYTVPTLVDGWRDPLVTLLKDVGAKDRYDEFSTATDNHIGVLNVSEAPLSGAADHSRSKSYLHKNGFIDRHGYSNTKYRPHSVSVPKHNYNKEFLGKGITPEYRQKYYDHRWHYKSAHTKYNWPSYKQYTRGKRLPWKHHREYRERRGIFDYLEQFGDMIGVTLRKCLLRAVCEFKTELMQEGESFIYDVARILFTVPTDHDHQDDDFTRMALAENLDCSQHFLVSCPHSPLEYFFNNFRTMNMK